MIKANFSIGFQATAIAIATVAHSLSFETLSIISKSSQILYDETLGIETGCNPEVPGSSPALTDILLELFLGCPEFNSSAALVHNQLVPHVMFCFKYYFFMFVSLSMKSSFGGENLFI